MSVRVDAAPTGPVTLSMGCGPKCSGRLDVTGIMRGAESKGWTTLSVPISCFRAVGTDLASLAAPFVLASRGSFALSLKSVRLARSETPAACADTPPAGAADALVSAPVRASAATVHVKKSVKKTVRKKSVGHRHGVRHRRR
jgi:beta-glucosidase